MPQLNYDVAESLLGDIVVVGSPRGITAIGLSGARDRESVIGGLTHRLKRPLVAEPNRHVSRAIKQIGEYLAGTRTVFDLPLDVYGSAFSRRVWHGICSVSYGRTTSYGELASSIGRPRATRAVANACGKNPLPLLIPCHRVIAADGSLGGFSAGLAIKRRLLTIERGSAQDLPLFAIARQTAGPDESIRTQLSLLDRLGSDLGSWLNSRLDDDPSVATIWLTVPEWVDAVYDEVDAVTLAELTIWLAQTWHATGVKRAEPIHTVAHELLDTLTNPSLLCHSADARIWRHALEAAFCLSEGPTVERIVAQYSAHARPKRKVAAAVLDTIKRVMDGSLTTSVALRERAVDLWLELEADPRRGTDRSFQDAGLWREAAIAAESRLALGEGDRTETLALLARCHEEMEEFASAAGYLKSLWLETEDAHWSTELRRIRALEPSQSPDGIENAMNEESFE